MSEAESWLPKILVLIPETWKCDFIWDKNDLADALRLLRWGGSSPVLSRWALNAVAGHLMRGAERDLTPHRGTGDVKTRQRLLMAQ